MSAENQRPRLACVESPRSLKEDKFYEIINKILVKVDEIHSDQTKSPRSKIESRTDAAVNNTQLVLKHLENFENNVLRQEGELRIFILRLEKEVLETRKELAEISHNTKIIEEKVLEMTASNEKALSNVKAELLKLEKQILESKIEAEKIKGVVLGSSREGIE